MHFLYLYRYIKFFISTNNKFEEETALEELWNYWDSDLRKPRDIIET